MVGIYRPDASSSRSSARPVSVAAAMACAPLGSPPPAPSGRRWNQPVPGVWLETACHFDPLGGGVIVTSCTTGVRRCPITAEVSPRGLGDSWSWRDHPGKWHRREQRLEFPKGHAYLRGAPS